MVKYFLFLFMIVLLNGCDTSTHPDETHFISEYMPLAPGNYWKYEGSYSSPDTSYVYQYTSTITQFEEKGNYKWYKIVSVINGDPQTRYLMIENDSVYELQYRWQYPVRSLEYLLPVQKVQSIHGLQGGDAGKIKTVTRLDTVITTQIGDFDNCLKFEYTNLDVTLIEIMALGVGIIERQVISHPFMGGGYESISVEKIVEFHKEW